MEIKHQINGNNGFFYVEKDGHRAALMTYKHFGIDKIIIEHTEVSESLKGQGLGSKMIEASVDFLRKNNLKVIPLCPFANAVFMKEHDQYADVLK